MSTKVQLTTRFLPDRAGTLSTRGAMVLAAIAIVSSVLAAPVLQRNAERIAQIRDPGIDRVLTGSTGQRSTSTTYTIRRSVLDDPSRPQCPNTLISDCR